MQIPSLYKTLDFWYDIRMGINAPEGENEPIQEGVPRRRFLKSLAAGFGASLLAAAGCTRLEKREKVMISAQVQGTVQRKRHVPGGVENPLNPFDLSPGPLRGRHVSEEFRVWIDFEYNGKIYSTSVDDQELFEHVERGTVVDADIVIHAEKDILTDGSSHTYHQGTEVKRARVR